MGKCLPNRKLSRWKKKVRKYRKMGYEKTRTKLLTGCCDFHVRCVSKEACFHSSPCPFHIWLTQSWAEQNELWRTGGRKRLDRFSVLYLPSSRHFWWLVLLFLSQNLINSVESKWILKQDASEMVKIVSVKLIDSFTLKNAGNLGLYTYDVTMCTVVLMASSWQGEASNFRI